MTDRSKIFKKVGNKLEFDEKTDVEDVFYENPLHLSVEKLYLKIPNLDNKRQQVKALDKYWATKTIFALYPILPETDTEEERKIWLKNAEQYCVELHFLLNLRFYKFWSYVLYVPAVTKMLDSFLQNAVPCYLPQPTDHYENIYSDIYDSVLSICERILTPKLSEIEFISPETLGKLLKEKDVITNDRLWDICKVYGHIDDGTIENMLKLAYEIIPDLKDNLAMIVHCMTEIFEAIGTAAYEEEAPTESLVNRLTMLLYDTAFSINMFMRIYPPFKDICINENLFSRIIHTYDSEVPILMSLMKSVYLSNDDPGFERVNNGRVEMLETCHSLMSYCMDMILQKSDSVIEQKKWIDSYLKLVSHVIEQHAFLSDFNKNFPISQDIEILQAICLNIDQERCNSILGALAKFQVEEDEAEAQETIQEEEILAGYGNLDEATVPDDILLDSQISELLDVFPNFGDGFLEQCLLHMNRDSQAVINAILEDNLSPNLAKLDRTLPRIPPEQPEAGASIEAAYVGKKPSEYQNMNELLNDKTHLQQQRERLLREYSMTGEEAVMYDDDYDDRYENDFGSYGVDTDSTDFIEGMINRRRRRGQVSEEEEQEDEEQKEEETKPRDAFCEDPALIRARREARYQQNRKGPLPNKSNDVVGKPKGQGQEKQVVQNRDKKNTHKSSRANHNRRQGAQWKRTRGMIPS